MLESGLPPVIIAFAGPPRLMLVMDQPRKNQMAMGSRPGIAPRTLPTIRNAPAHDR